MTLSNSNEWSSDVKAEIQAELRAEWEAERIRREQEDARESVESRIRRKKFVADLARKAGKYIPSIAAIVVGYGAMALGDPGFIDGVIATLFGYSSIAAGVASGGVMGVLDASSILRKEAEDEERLLLGEEHGK